MDESAYLPTYVPGPAQQVSQEHREWIRILVQTYPEGVLLREFGIPYRPVSSYSHSTASIRSRSSLSSYAPTTSTGRTSISSDSVYGQPNQFHSFQQPFNASVPDLSRSSLEPQTVPQFVVQDVGGPSAFNTTAPLTDNSAVQSPIRTAPTSAGEEHATPQKKFFCPLCNDKVVWISRDSDWRRHMNNFHNPEKQLPCPELNCKRTFEITELAKFMEHHQKRHRCQDCNQTHAEEAVRARSVQVAFACGYANPDKTCKFIATGSSSWLRWLEHVLRHFTEDGMLPEQWDHSTAIRNLLRRPEIRKTWHTCLTYHLGVDKERWPRFNWRQGNTDQLKWQLEHGDLRTDQVDICKEAYTTGLPQTFAVDFSTNFVPPDSPPPKHSHHRSSKKGRDHSSTPNNPPSSSRRPTISSSAESSKNNVKPLPPPPQPVPPQNVNSSDTTFSIGQQQVSNTTWPQDFFAPTAEPMTNLQPMAPPNLVVNSMGPQDIQMTSDDGTATHPLSYFSYFDHFPDLPEVLQDESMQYEQAQPERSRFSIKKALKRAKSATSVSSGSRRQSGADFDGSYAPNSYMDFRFGSAHDGMN